MADFAIRNLSVLGYAQGFTSWVYRTDTIPSLFQVDWNDNGYFNDAADMFNVGDTIIVYATNPSSDTVWRAASLVVDDLTDSVKFRCMQMC